MNNILSYNQYLILENGSTPYSNRSQNLELNEKRKTKNSPSWKDSDAPAATGKFKELRIKELAKWLIRTRGGDMRKITGSLNQQIVFNRNDNPTYAKKMESVRAEVKRQLGKKNKK